MCTAIRLLVTLLIVLLAENHAAAQAPVDVATRGHASVVDRFLARPVETVTQYRAFRRLEARNDRFKKHGWMEVLTELSPEDGFTYRVLAEGGSDYVRRKALRPILDGEREIIARGDVTRAALTLDNYEWRGEGVAESGLVKVLVQPRRRDLMLIDGAVFVSRDEADLVQVAGRLAKSPSFWTTHVDVTRRYGRIAGVRVPLSVESVAHVRIAGPSTLSMTYRYEMVNGVAVAADEGSHTVSALATDDPVGATLLGQ